MNNGEAIKNKKNQLMKFYFSKNIILNNCLYYVVLYIIGINKIFFILNYAIRML